MGSKYHAPTAAELGTGFRHHLLPGAFGTLVARVAIAMSPFNSVLQM
jgi:hypothetical protein